MKSTQPAVRVIFSYNLRARRLLAALVLASTLITPLAPTMARADEAAAPVTTDVTLATPSSDADLITPAAPIGSTSTDQATAPAVPDQTPAEVTPAPESPAPADSAGSDEAANSATPAKPEEPTSDASAKTDSNKQVTPMTFTGTPVPAILEKGSSGIALPNAAVLDNTGALTYSYDFRLPKGRGTTPDLHLAYNSQDNRDRGFGYGWSISIPYIERLPKHGVNALYSENYFTSSVSGELSQVDATHYAAKRERGDFVDYEFLNGAWNARTKDGLIYVYGKTAAERLDNSASTTQVFSWMLSEIDDANGNVVRYTYFKDGDSNAIYPATIQYPIWRNPANGSETSPNFTVNFSRTDYSSYPSIFGTPSSYRAGFQVQLKKRTTQISVTGSSLPNDPFASYAAPGAMFSNSDRRYNLSYTAGEDGSRSLLGTVTENWTNANFQQVSLSTSFSYSKTAPAQQTWSASSWQFPSDISIQFGEGDTSSSGWAGTGGNSRLADVNGDGLLDIVSATNTYINSGSGWAKQSAWALPTVSYSSGFCSGSLQMDVTSGNYPFDGSQIQIADINGDGAADLLAVNSKIWCYYNGSSYPVPFTGIFMGGPNGWTANTSWSFPTGLTFGTLLGNQGNTDTGCRLADVNGDGLADVTCSQLDQTPHIYLNNGSGWAETTTMTLPTAEWCYDAYHYVHYNKTLAFNDPGRNSQIPLSFADMNGDGLPDLVLDGNFCTNPNYTPVAGNTIFLNTGTTWVQSGTLISSPGTPSAAHRIMSDVNGDGLDPDFAYASSMTPPSSQQVYPASYEGMLPQAEGTSGYYTGDLSGSGWQGRHWYFPTTTSCDGTTSYNVGFSQKYPANYNRSNVTATDLPTAVQIADIDGDGVADLLGFNSMRPCDTYFATGDFGQGPGLYIHYGSGWHKQASGDFPRDQVLWRNQGRKADLLTTITSQHQAVTTVTYAMAATVTDSSGQRITAQAPVNVPVVTQIQVNPGLGASVTETYGYSGGYYRVSAYDDREFAGFHLVKKQDAAGASTTTYYHQGDGNDAATHENDDHASKVGLPYRVERRDNDGSLRDTVITRYSRVTAPSLAGDRWFVASASALEIQNGADSSTAASAQGWQYDSASGNVTQSTDYGDVTPAADGTFTDITADPAVTTAYSYASPTGSARLAGLVTQALKTDQNGTTLGRAKSYYDGLAFGLAAVGNMTESHSLIDSATGIEAVTSATYAADGVVLTSTDARGAVTTYDYGGLDLYPTSETWTPNGIQLTTTYYYHWMLGLRRGTMDASGLKELDDYDGFGRPVAHHVGSPLLSLQTSETWTYDDVPSGSSLPGVGFEHDTYGAGNGTTAERVYMDGLGRTARDAKTLPDPAGSGNSAWTVQDTVYDAEGRVQKASLPFLGTPSATLDPRVQGALQAPTDSRQWSVYAYDGLGRTLSTTTAVGVTTNAYGARTAMTTDPLGHYKTLTDDARGRLVQVAEHNHVSGSPVTYTTTYAYDANGNLTNITDADANVRNFAYDLLGRRLTAEDLHATGDATFGVSSYAYDGNGNVTQQTKPDSSVLTYTYDDLNRVTLQTATGLPNRSFVYDTPCPMGQGRLCTENLPNGGYVKYEYDGRGRVAKKTTQADATHAYVETDAYDLRGLKLSTTQSDGAQTAYAYFGDFVTGVSFAKSATSTAAALLSSIAYAPTSQVTQVRYTDGATTTFTYDPNNLNRLMRKLTVVPDGSYTTVSTTTTTTFAPTTASFYSGTGDGYIQDGGSSWSTVHGASTGSHTSSTDPYLYPGSGGNNTSKYIARAFLPFYTAAIPDTETVASATLMVYPYYRDDNLGDGLDWATVVHTTQSSTTTLVAADYSKAGATTNPVEGIDPGNRLSLMLPGGINHYVNFPLNATGLSWVSATGTTMLGLRDGHDVTNTPCSCTFNYSNYDNLDIYSRENGLSTAPILQVTYGHNVTTVTSTTTTTPVSLTAQDLNYTYDSVGNITHVTDASQTASNKLATYAYDDLDRLLSATVTNASSTPMYSEAYTYGPTGNILTKTTASGTGTPVIATYQYAGNQGTSYANPHAATSIGALALVYDMNGNLTASGTTTYVWNAEGRLTSALTGSGSSTYAYDASGRRLTSASAATTTYYPSDEYNDTYSGATLSDAVKHVFLNGAALATYQGAGSNPAGYLDYTDNLTGTSVSTDMSGTVAELEDYLPYGGMRVDQKSGSFSEQRKFGGHEFDVASGLSYMGARYYDASTGRFLSEDPAFLTTSFNLADPQSLNSYAYARNNPLKYIDPNGESFQSFADAALQHAPGAIMKATGAALAAVALTALSAPAAAAIGLTALGIETGRMFADSAHAASDLINSRGGTWVTDTSAYRQMSQDQKDAYWGDVTGGAVETAAPYAGAAIGAGLGSKATGLGLGSSRNNYPSDLGKTLDRIEAGERNPHVNDGSVFRNDQGKLPQQSSGYYREYVHPTPGVNGAGVQRVITGSNGEAYYTPDHYETFTKVK